MKLKSFFLLLLFHALIAQVYCQNAVSVKINRDVPHLAKKGTFGNCGVGVAVVRKDPKRRFINYELSAGIDFDNLTIKDQFNNPPFLIDYNPVYTHKINSLNLNVAASVKKRFFNKSDYTPYIGAGLVPECFLFSRAKVYSSDGSLMIKGDGLRLAVSGERFKIFDLFYLGLECKDRIDFRFNMQGLILKRLGLNQFYYYKSEGNVTYGQYSLQVIINLSR